MSDKATSKVFDRTDILTKLDATEKALTEMTTLRDIALRDFVIATDKWERAEVQIIDLKARIEKLRLELTWYADYTITERHPEHKEFNMGYRAQKALEADDAASK